MRRPRQRHASAISVRVNGSRASSILRRSNPPATLATPSRLALAGALEGFAEHPTKPVTHWENVAGASAGAIIACYLATGHDAAQMLDLMKKTNFGQFADFPAHSKILGGGRLLAIRKVLAPLIKKSLAGAWLLVFIPATRELSSAIFLVGPNTRVISVMLFDLSEEGNFEVLSALGVILLVTTVAIAALGFRLIGRDFMLRRAT